MKEGHHYDTIVVSAGQAGIASTDGETFTARSVIVATGAYHRAYIPAFASAFSPNLVQRHSSEYPNPGALPPGGVLVVGHYPHTGRARRAHHARDDWRPGARSDLHLTDPK
jgi:putative flavoprotein involved in K+ transport